MSYKCRLILESVIIRGSEFGFDPVDLEKHIELPFVPVPHLTIDAIRYKRCNYSTTTGEFTLVALEYQLGHIPEGFTRIYDWDE